VLGFTYNFENTHTLYQNGVDMHLDVATSKFITKELQLAWSVMPTSNCPAILASATVSAVSSRVSSAAGPQIKYNFPLGDHLQGYLNLNGYKEFGAEHRPEGLEHVADLRGLSRSSESGTGARARGIHK
jgi:hypothetical protein